MGESKKYHNLKTYYKKYKRKVFGVFKNTFLQKTKKTIIPKTN